MHVHTTVYLFTFKTLGAFFKLKFTCYHIILNMPVPSMVGIQMAKIHTNTLNKLITGGLRFYFQETGLSSMSRSLTLQNCGTLASTHFWNSFRFLNGTIQAPSQNSFKISKCHPGVLVGGQLSSMLKEGVIPSC